MIINVDFDTTGQLQIIQSAFVKYLRKYGNTMNQVLINIKNAYDSITKEVLNNILIEFRIPKKLVRQIKMFLNETHSRVRVGKHLSDMFSISTVLKQGDALTPLLFTFDLEYTIRSVRLTFWRRIFFFKF